MSRQKYIKISVTAHMENEYEECVRMMDEDNIAKDCDGCSLNGGYYGCLGEMRWNLEKNDYKAKNL